MFPGVPIFFVVSGFLVTQSFLENDSRLGPYALNRAPRIYPGLWTNFLVIIALLTATGSLTLAMVGAEFFKYQAAQFLFGSEKYAFMLSSFRYHFSATQLFHEYPSGVLWTINVGFGFYLLVPLLFHPSIVAQPRLLNALMALAAAASWAATIMAHMVKVAPIDPATILLAYGPLPLFPWIFLLGAASYPNWARVRFLFEDRFLGWLSAYLVLGMIATWGLGGPSIDFSRVKPLVVLKSIALAGTGRSFAHSQHGLASFLRGRDISYGLYLNICRSSSSC